MHCKAVTLENLTCGSPRLWLSNTIFRSTWFAPHSVPTYFNPAVVCMGARQSHVSEKPHLHSADSVEHPCPCFQGHSPSALQILLENMLLQTSTVTRKRKVRNAVLLNVKKKLFILSTGHSEKRRYEHLYTPFWWVFIGRQLFKRQVRCWRERVCLHSSFQLPKILDFW